MFKPCLVLTIAAALLSPLSGCRLGIFGINLEHENFSLSGFTAIEGSDSIMGTWVGVTVYSANIDVWAEVEGSQLRVIQINSDGVGGYQTYDCKGAVSEVNLNLESNSIELLGRGLSLGSFNEISGNATYEEERFRALYRSNEKWSWLKISNEDTGLGQVNIDIIAEQISSYEQSVLAFCLHSYIYTDNEDSVQHLDDVVSVAWDEESDTKEYLSAVDRTSVEEGFIVESDKRKFFNIPSLKILMSSKSATINFSKNNNLPQKYTATFEADGPSSSTFGDYVIKVDLNLIIPK